jgi:hypothetical protein
VEVHITFIYVARLNLSFHEKRACINDQGPLAPQAKPVNLGVSTLEKNARKNASEVYFKELKSKAVQIHEGCS